MVKINEIIWKSKHIGRKVFFFDGLDFELHGDELSQLFTLLFSLNGNILFFFGASSPAPALLAVLLFHLIGSRHLFADFVDWEYAALLLAHKTS